MVLDLNSTLTVPTDGDLPDGFRVPVLLSLSSCDLRGAATQSVERTVAGNTIQFRHGRLQHWLISRAVRPGAAASPRG